MIYDLSGIAAGVFFEHSIHRSSEIRNSLLFSTDLNSACCAHSFDFKQHLILLILGYYANNPKSRNVPFQAVIRSLNAPSHRSLVFFN